MPRNVTIRFLDGETVMLVGSGDVGVLRGGAEVRRRLQEAVQDHPFVAEQLVKFADSQMLLSAGDAPHVEEAIEAIAWAFERGVVTTVLTSEGTFGRPILPGGRSADWEDARWLSDLVPREPAARPRPATPAKPVFVDPRDAWMSFEVVDDEGHGADGAFRGAIDGSTHEGALERRAHVFRDLSTSASGTVHLELRSFSTATPTMSFDGPVPGGTPTQPTRPRGPEDPDVPQDPISPATEAGRSFDVVDEQGRELLGRYILRTSGGEIVGELGAVVRVEGSGPASVEIAPRWDQASG